MSDMQEAANLRRLLSPSRSALTRVIAVAQFVMSNGVSIDSLPG